MTAVQTISARTAKALRARCDRHNAWASQYIKPNGWTVITREEQKTCPRNARITNEERGRLEQFELLRDLPERFAAYAKLVDIADNPSGYTMRNVTRGCYVMVTTWPGDTLGKGRITSLESWRSNWGDMRAAFTVVIGGARYHGTMTDAHDIVRLRKAKT